MVPTLQDGDAVDEIYIDFEEKMRNKEIESFAQENNIDNDKLLNAISDYEFSEILDDEYVDKEICSGMGFRERRKMRNNISNFVRENCLKYKA